ARGLLARGGVQVIVTVPSTPGNSDNEGGSTRAQPAEGPTTSTSNRSTIDPALRTLTDTAACPPGSTVGSLRDSDVTALIRGSLRGRTWPATRRPGRSASRVPSRRPG